MGRVNGIAVGDRLVAPEFVAKLLLLLDESLLDIEARGHEVRLAPEKIQRRHQLDQTGSRVGQARRRSDAMTDRARRSRKRLRGPGCQGEKLLRRQGAVSTLKVELRQSRHAALAVKLEPSPDRVVGQNKGLRGLIAAPALAQQEDRVGATSTKIRNAVHPLTTAIPAKGGVSSYGHAKP